MTGIGEGIAELGQTIATASALEPAHGQSGSAVAGDGHTHERRCLNCGTGLLGSHCHSCGQAAHVHRTIGAFFHDLLHGVFHFEGKIWRTLPLLVWKPGRLTREYIDGRRASYVSPIALFLFSVFLMFAVFHATEGHEEVSRDDGQTTAQQIARIEGQIAGIEGKKKAAAARGRPTENYDLQITARRAALTAMREATAEKVEIRTDPDRKVSDIPMLDKAIKKFRSNPDLASYKLQTYAYKYSWALIPISVPFLWLLFPFSRRFHLYDHTVFVTYSLCFMTLLLVLGMIVNAVGPGGLIAPLIIVAPPLHMYRQLRGTYALGRAAALWRTSFLIVFAAVALALFFSVLMAQTSL